jgi:hypothetical protein
MEDPQSPMAQNEFANEESENEGRPDSFESPSDPYPPCKSQQPYGPQDEDYISEQEVYDH